jgi:glycosyltransferase involved in cell wall biosynthesis
MNPFVSICIPAYKRVSYLKRLLESIIIQTYKDFEVVITDDSDNDSVKDLVKEYENRLPIRYFKNEYALGTPANWNCAISKAKGQWIKLMHDDDWFSTPESLARFVNFADNDHPFIFSAYYTVPETSARKLHKLSEFKNTIAREPGILFAKNVIGPPSVTLIQRNISENYDERLKWRVDIEFYMRVLKQSKHYTYIDTPLINIGLNESQVTQSAINNPEIELPEGWLLLKEYGVKSLRNIQVYDAWWRLFRNMNIRDKKQLYSYVNEKWPDEILAILNSERKIPPSFLKAGPISKFLMLLSYLKNRSRIK